MTSKIDPRKQRIINAYGREPGNLDELAQCTIATINTYRSTRSKKLCKVVGFAWELTFGNVSNTHSAPMDGIENWGNRIKGAPTSYPGWNGRVWIRYGEEIDGFSADPFGITLTHPGTGGSGAYDGPWKSVLSAHWKQYGYKRSKDIYPRPDCCSWDYRIYLSDWPKIRDDIEQQQVYNKLAGINKNSNPNTHKYLWEDSETKIADAAFIAECAIIKAKETV